MRIISHRGNIQGSNSKVENTISQIDKCINFGYDVEIDIRKIDNNFYLGHDNPNHYVSLNWLKERISNLWIHCKNLKSLLYFLDTNIDFNFFWHQSDDYVITSKKIIWTYPGKTFTSKSVIVMPENNFNLIDFYKLKEYNVYGICTDYPDLLK